MYRYRLEYIKDQDTRHTVVKDHQNLIDAIVNKDVDSAKVIIVGHIEHQEKTIMKNMGFESN